MAAAQRIADDHPAGTLAAARGGGHDLDVRFVIEHAASGDAESQEVMAVVGRHLGVGIANYVNIFNPELVVIGGGISSAGEHLLGPARDEYQRRVLRATGTARVVVAELGNDAGVLGAAALLFDE
jgi:glucokinase